MAELITQAEYARRRDVSRQYIHRLVTQGKIPTDELKRIDPEIADAVLAQLSDPARRLNEMPEETESAAEIYDQDPATEPAGNGHASFAKFRSAREAYQAKLAQMDYEERAGKLVRKEEIDREAFEAARLIRDRFLSLPQELAGTLVGMTDEKEIIQYLRGKIRDALMDVSNDVSLGA
ncbi:MAG: hypothetical protein HYS17_03420 [Micavibrio aeruginosavorus]|uniref:Terminase small subunit n=1 Tax=Micavibrio aeruginosavorus TaxID=349221 RepID=A0A7T5R3N3_9BACT|nr:MAG: hypothetical protein HYS17_03420 [Micavibrio aeruginosavorus]